MTSPAAAPRTGRGQIAAPGVLAQVRGATRETHEALDELLPLGLRHLADYRRYLAALQPLAEWLARGWRPDWPAHLACWHDGVRLEVFEVRHHWPRSAFGLRLRGSLAWTGDTRPIPEVLAAVADQGELIAHDCGLHGNPSHSGIDDLEREYAPELLARCVLYHYAS